MSIYLSIYLVPLSSLSSLSLSLSSLFPLSLSSLSSVISPPFLSLISLVIAQEHAESCQAITSGDVATHNGQAFHKECFTCQTCGKPVPDGAFMPAKDGTVHCKPCFFKHGGFT